MRNKEHYDILIIGSGLSGLLCGYILSVEGYKAGIVEKNPVMGGCLQSFSRSGQIFETGIHYIGSLGEGELLNRFFRYFGLLGTVDFRKMDENGFDIVNIGGEVFRLPNGFENFSAYLKQHFPGESAAIDKYVEKIFEATESLRIFSNGKLQSGNGFAENQFAGMCAWECICGLFSSNTLRELIFSLAPLYSGNSEKTSFYEHAMIMRSFIESAWKPVGGSLEIVKSLAHAIESRGGQFILGDKAESFDFEGINISSLKLASGRTIFADTFISSIHPREMLKLVSGEQFRQVYRNRIESIGSTISVFTVYCSLRKNSFPFLDYNYYYYGCAPSESIEKGDCTNMFILYTPAGKNPEYAETLILISYMPFDQVKKWEDTTIGKRGTDYEQFKTASAETLLNLAGEHFPDLRDAIESYHTSSPLTYRDYTATVEGSIYGIQRDCHNPAFTFISPRTKLPNLLLTGQNTNLHGVLGVTIGSILTCSEIVGFEYLVNKINSLK